MSRRRCYTGSEGGSDSSKLLFYASLANSKVPDYVINGDKAIRTAGLSIIQNNEWLSTSISGTFTTIYNYIPSDVNGLTLAAYVTPDQQNWNRAFGLGYIPGSTKYKSLWFAVMGPTRLIIGGHNNELVDFLLSTNFIGTKHFFTFTYKRMSENNVVLTTYMDGVKIHTDLVNIPVGYLADSYVCIGADSGSNTNLPGKVSRYSIHEFMTDEQVLALYNNGGVPVY